MKEKFFLRLSLTVFYYISFSQGGTTIHVLHGCFKAMVIMLDYLLIMKCLALWSNATLSKRVLYFTLSSTRHVCVLTNVGRVPKRVSATTRFEQSVSWLFPKYGRLIGRCADDATLSEAAFSVPVLTPVAFLFLQSNRVTQ